jgi:Domain of unknown function (DUF4157)/Putative peptidoglycan binding domain
MKQAKAVARSTNDIVHNVAAAHNRVLVWNERDPGTIQAANEMPPLAGLASADKSWNFCLVPLHPPGQPNRRLPFSSLAPFPKPAPLQPKLAVGRIDDPLEREADAVAEQVMRMPDPAFSPSSASAQISRKCAECEVEEEKEKEKLQRRQARPAGPAVSEAPLIVHEVLRSPGRPLGPATRAFFEPRFGRDFGQVRIHTDARAAESARAVNALAYTVGRDVVFGPGQYLPETTAGRKLLAHELTHTIQQAKGATLTDKSVQPRDVNDVQEREAETPQLQRQPATPPTPAPHLTCPRFAGDPILEACFNGKHRMTIGETGPSVAKVQSALLDLGFSLPQFGADGKYGSETAAAVSQFKRTKGITPSDGVVGPKTMNALDAACPPSKAPPGSESRAVVSKVEVKTEKKGEIEGGTTKAPEVKASPTGTTTVSSRNENPPGEDEPAFQFTAEVDIQNKWQLAGSPGEKPDVCDFGVMQIGGKWNWTGVPIGKKLTLFSEPELDVNLLPAFCGKAPGITLQDNFLKWTITKNVWELALVGAFGFKDGWLKDWGGDKPLTGLVGPELDWKPWANKKNVWYNGLKLKLNISSVWEKAPEGQKDLWGVQASGGLGIELP